MWFAPGSSPPARMRGHRLRHLVAITALAMMMSTACSGHQRENQHRPTDSARSTQGSPMAPKVAVGFGYKTGWLAFRTSTQDEVVRALLLSWVKSADWPAAIDAAYARTGSGVAVTPPLHGVGGDWVLATGTPLMLHEPDTADLSKVARTEVQYFVSDRITETHGWARSVGGTLVRSFEFSGDTGELLSWEGRPDAAERGIGLPDVAHPDQTRTDAVFDLGIDEATVMTIAKAWSIDPTGLDGLTIDDEPLVGDM